jgi:hypothetical protein
VSGIFVAVLCQLYMFGLRIASEAALCLQCGLLIVEGKRPYIDFFEVSSPALMYFNAIPAVFCKLLPIIHPIMIFHTFVFLLAVASCLLTARILQRQRTREQAHTPFFVIGLALLNWIAIAEFGQREHLFLLLFIPFFVSRWLTWTNQPVDKRLSLIAGTAGGIGICLDPLFLLVLFFMELYFLVTKQRWSPFKAVEFKAAIVVLLLYLLHFAFFPREYSALYFNYALPMVLCDYITFDDRLWWVGKTPDNRNIVYFMVIVACIALGLRRWCSLIPPFVGLSIVGFGLFVIEGKSMTYQMLPIVYGAFLSLCLIVSIVANFAVKSGWIKNGFLKPVLVAACTSVVVVGATFQLTRNHDTILDLSKLGYIGSCYWTEESAFSTRMEAATKPNDPILVLNDRVRPAYPLMLQLERRPASYLLTGYPLRMSRILWDHDKQRIPIYSGLQFQMYERLINDIKTVKPKFVMIEKESLGDVLKEHKVMDVIDELYDEYCFAEFPDTESQPSFDYYSFRTALACYRLKSEAPPSE